MVRALVLIALLAGAGAAHAGPWPATAAWPATVLSLDPGPDPEPPPPPKPPPRDEIVVLSMRVSDEGRWEAGTGVMGGWRPLADLHLRYYMGDSTTAGAGLRFDLDGAAPRAFEIDFGLAIGIGKMRFPGDRVTRDRLMLEWGAGAVRLPEVYSLYGFAGLALRVQPGVDWLSVELRVREALAPSPVEAAARSTATPPPTFAHGFATEVGVAVSVLWPGPRRECVRIRGRR